MSMRFGVADATHSHQDARLADPVRRSARGCSSTRACGGYEPGDPERAWTQVARGPQRGDRRRAACQPDRHGRAWSGRAWVAGSTEAVVSLPLYRNVSMRRRVLFSTREGYMVVEDVVRSSTPVTVRQLWHLLPGSRPTTSRSAHLDPRSTRQPAHRTASWPGHERAGHGVPGALPGVARRSATGDSFRRPCSAVRPEARSVRFITLIAPFRSGAPRVQVRRLRITENGFSMTIRVNGHTERIRATCLGCVHHRR